MKTLFTIMLGVICLTSTAQIKIDTIPQINGQYQYQGVVNVPNAKKDDLYKNAKLFFANEFKSAINVIQYDDRNEGKIIGKGMVYIEDKRTLMLTPLLYKWNVFFTIQIECKDGKYRYTLYDFSIKQRIYNGEEEDMTFGVAYSQALKGSYKKIFIDLINKSSGAFNETVTTINRYMENKTVISNGDF